MFLLRHGQSLFNLHFTATRRDPGIEDPELTALGHAQAVEAAAALAGERITRIIISPYTRALQTAAAVLAVHDVPVTVMHEVRERAAFACDVGQPASSLAKAFPQHQFGHLPEVWWGDGVETEQATAARAAAFRTMMAEQDSATTLLVSHWGFILALTGVSAGNGEVLAYDVEGRAPVRVVWQPRTEAA